MNLQAARVRQGIVPPSILAIDRNREMYFFCKRLVDAAVSASLLILLAPLIALIAIAIKLDSPGPLLFRHTRVGTRRRTERGRTRWEIRPFTLYKFRSMVPNADQSLHVRHVRAFISGKLKAGKEGNARFKLADDPRVTRIGRLLRRTSLDELPQLICVLKGDMSLVGPRPVPEYEVAEYRQTDMERLSTIQGLTGLWQVSGRTDLSFAEMIRFDREYIRKQSLWLDLRILAATIPAVISGRGAR